VVVHDVVDLLGAQILEDVILRRRRRRLLLGGRRRRRGRKSVCNLDGFIIFFIIGFHFK
jgi:hypothetical protein